MNMKKLAFFTVLDITYLGGKEKNLIEVAKLLRPYFNITIFSPGDNEPQKIRKSKEIERDTNASVRPYHLFEPFRLYGIFTIPTRSAIMAISALKNYDLVYLSDPINLMSLLVILYSNIIKKPLIFSIQSPLLLRDAPIKNTLLRRWIMWVYKPLRNALVLSCPIIHVVNRDDLIKLKRLHYKGKIHLIPNLIPSYIKKEDIGVNEKKFTIIFSGRFDIEQKGVDLLKEIAEGTIKRNSNIHFHLAGHNGNGTHIVKALANKYPKNVQLSGFLSSRKLKKAYKNADMVVSTSRYESCSISLIEAQALGCPAVAFQAKGQDTVITKATQGKLIKPYQTNEFIDAINYYYKKWATDKKSYRRLKKQISNIAIDKFSTNITITRVKRMFDLSMRHLNEKLKAE